MSLTDMFIKDFNRDMHVWDVSPVNAKDEDMWELYNNKEKMREMIDEYLNTSL